MYLSLLVIYIELEIFRGTEVVFRLQYSTTFGRLVRSRTSPRRLVCFDEGRSGWLLGGIF